MKSVTTLASKLLAASAFVALVASFGSVAHASGDPDSVSMKYPTLPNAYSAPANPDQNAQSASDRDVGPSDEATQSVTPAKPPVNLGQGSGIGRVMGR